MILWKGALMAYATPDDIVAIYGADALARLTDADSVGAVDRPRAAQALAFAGSQIDGYLLARYALPLPVIPGLVKMLAIDIAVYRLAQDHARLTEEISKRYDEAMRALRDIGAGRALLPLPTPAGGASAAPATSIVVVEGAPRVMDRGLLRRL